jgi:hypothetical protein
MSTTVVARVSNGLSRGFNAFVRKMFDNKEELTFGDKFWGGFILLIILLVGSAFSIVLVVTAWDTNQFNRLTPAQHLAKMREACGPTAHCADTEEAIRHLEAVPAAAPEHAEASQFLTEIHKQVDTEKENKTAAAREQMIRNFNGDAHDLYSCAMSTTNEPIVSFDGTLTWWKDDGRCAARLQRKRDVDAQLNSYWSTTLRVDTDMNSSWLQDEERTCQTYPDAKGKVSSVRCSTSEGATHNIPVEFWGGVDRNTVSDWKCRREKSILDDRFVCRAIN